MVATSRRKLAGHTLGMDGMDKAVDLMAGKAMDWMDEMDWMDRRQKALRDWGRG